MKKELIITNEADIKYVETYENVDYEVEQLPETFEEFKDYCKNIKDCEVENNSVIFFFQHIDEGYFKLAEFKQEGSLYIAEKIIGLVDCVKIGSKLSIEQMYQFLTLFKNIRDKEYYIDKK